MSHQTGIQASEELRGFFAKAKEDTSVIRVIQVGVEDEQLVLQHRYGATGTWEDDYDKLVIPLCQPKQPTYILYRLDSRNDAGYEWIYICYSPDQAPVRQKMLYAATRSTLKKEFGGGLVKEEIFGTNIDDIRLSGFKKHLVSQNAPAPLTMAEEELEEIKKNEVNAHIHVDSKHQTITGVAFPISQEAVDRLVDLRDGHLDYVQLSLDLDAEEINLESYEPTTVAQLPSRVPSDHARYHFFTFKHTHEGDYLQSIIFIYSMPGYKCSIKERMLYSSCKAPLLDIAEQQLGIEIAKRMEIDEGAELTEAFLMEEVHPKKDIIRKKFDKPKGPGGRGPRRMVRQKDDNTE